MGKSSFFPSPICLVYFVKKKMDHWNNVTARWNELIDAQILSSMLIYQHVIVDLSQSALAVGWGYPLHTWLSTVNWITWAPCPNTRKPYEACAMHYPGHYHISLPQYSQNSCTCIFMIFTMNILNYICMCPNFERRYWAIAELQRHKLNMF